MLHNDKSCQEWALRSSVHMGSPRTPARAKRTSVEVVFLQSILENMVHILHFPNTNFQNIFPKNAKYLEIFMGGLPVNLCFENDVTQYC